MIMVILLFTLLLSVFFFDPIVPYLIIYKKNKTKKHKVQWNSREGTANLSRDVYGLNATPQLAFSCQYSWLFTPCCCWRVCSSLKTLFIIQDIFYFENLFVNQFVHNEKHSWLNFLLYLDYKNSVKFMLSLICQLSEILGKFGIKESIN